MYVDTPTGKQQILYKPALWQPFEQSPWAWCLCDTRTHTHCHHQPLQTFWLRGDIHLTVQQNLETSVLFGEGTCVLVTWVNIHSFVPCIRNRQPTLRDQKKVWETYPSPAWSKVKKNDAFHLCVSLLGFKTKNDNRENNASLLSGLTDVCAATSMLQHQQKQPHQH